MRKFPVTMIVEGGVFRYISSSESVEVGYPKHKDDAQCPVPAHQMFLDIEGADVQVTGPLANTPLPWSLLGYTVDVKANKSQNIIIENHRHYQ